MQHFAYGVTSMNSTRTLPMDCEHARGAAAPCFRAARSAGERSVARQASACLSLRVCVCCSDASGSSAKQARLGRSCRMSIQRGVVFDPLAPDRIRERASVHASCWNTCRRCKYTIPVESVLSRYRYHQASSMQLVVVRMLCCARLKRCLLVPFPMQKTPDKRIVDAAAILHIRACQMNMSRIRITAPRSAQHL